MWKILFEIVRDFTRKAAQDNISAHAASTAFFLFLSLLPLLMLACSLLPYTPVTEAMLMRLMMRVTPDAANGLMVTLISEAYKKSVGVASVAAVVTLWTASKGMLALMRGLNAVNDVQEQRNYFILRLQASFYTIFMLAATMAALVIVVFGNRLVNLLFRDFPTLYPIISGILHFRLFPVWIFLSLIFAVIYTYVPHIQTSLSFQLPGAFFAAIAWILFSWGFSVYVDLFNAFSMYGNLTTIIIVMFWLYFCMYILLIGANINRYLLPAMKYLRRRRK